ncbi:hypothetical protein K2X92_05155 [Candidatus Gracilibacteria bacterium]|nr:hypothetical protein [Candidatus Gracilibacteria bacterium]
MYKLNRSHQGSALLVGFVIVVLLTIMTTSFLDKVLNLGKTSGGINSSAQSYTLATGIIEEQLMDSSMTKQSPWNIIERSEGTFSLTGRSLKAYTGGFTIPDVGKGNSTFSTDWNIISIGDPVQIVIPGIPTTMDWSNVSFRFRVPNIPNETGATGSTFSSGIILWTFGYSGASLYASGETNIFKFNDIVGNTGPAKQLISFNGQTNTGVAMAFTTFAGAYGSNCGSFQCTLKLSMIRPFISSIGRSYSFLEYQITFPMRIPSQYMVIDSSAYINGYLRSRQVRIPQITTNTATDFAILQ